MVTSNLEVSVSVKPRKRVSEPHHISILEKQKKTESFSRTWNTFFHTRSRKWLYREDKVVTQFKNRTQEVDSSPHHLQVRASHEVSLLSGEINTFCFETEAVLVKLSATGVSFSIQSNDHQVVQEHACSFTDSKTLEEEVDNRARSCPSFVQSR